MNRHAQAEPGRNMKMNETITKAAAAREASLTPYEQWLAARGLLDPDRVESRLDHEAESRLEAALADAPRPLGYAAPVCGIVGRLPDRGHQTHRDPAWVPTISAVESTTGHPVERLVAGQVEVEVYSRIQVEGSPTPRLILITYLSQSDE